MELILLLPAQLWTLVCPMFHCSTVEAVGLPLAVGPWALARPSHHCAHFAARVSSQATVFLCWSFCLGSSPGSAPLSSSSLKEGHTCVIRGWHNRAPHSLSVDSCPGSSTLFQMYWGIGIGPSPVGNCLQDCLAEPSLVCPADQ